MTKKVWGAFSIIFFVISCGLAVFLYLTVKNKTIKEVPLKQVVRETMPAPAAPDVTTTTFPKITAEAKTKGEEPEKVEKKTDVKKLEAKKADHKKTENPAPAKSGGIRNILFSYHNSKAQNVLIEGDFTNWEPQAMAKKGKSYSIAFKLAPGSYQYEIIVDGKTIPDPNNRHLSKEGKSILTVKPLGSK